VKTGARILGKQEIVESITVDVDENSLNLERKEHLENQIEASMHHNPNLLTLKKKKKDTILFYCDVVVNNITTTPSKTELR
jgi:ribosomal protein L11 methylase PrmA